MYKKILLIGRIDSTFTTQFVEYITQTGLVVDILDITNSKYLDSNLQTINQRYFSVLSKHSLLVLFIERIINCFKLLNHIKDDYDYIQYFYIKYEYLILHKYINRKGKYIIMNIFGNDFNENPFKKFYKFMYVKTDKFAFTSQILKLDFFNYYINLSNKNKFITPFGLKQIEVMDKIIYGKKRIEIKQYFLNTQKTVVTIGSSGQNIEQHMRIFNALLESTIDFSNILLILPITYGKSDNNIFKSLIPELNKRVEIIIFDNFLSYEDLANLRFSTDIFISLRSSDQLCGAIIEHLFAGSVVITGSWLNYKPWKDIGLDFLEISGFDKLEAAINKSVQLIDNYEMKRIRNREIIENNYTWKHTINSWLELYKD